MQGVVAHLAGVDPEEEWQLRGIAGHRPEEWDRYCQQKVSRLEQSSKDPAIRARLDEFLKECMALFEGIIGNDREIVSKYVGDRTFYFVLGLPRSGGTYIYTEIGRAVSWPWKKLSHSMTHDFYVIHDPSGMQWRNPAAFADFIFVLSQIFVYIYRRIGQTKNIVLKNLYFSHCLGLLDCIFGAKAHYIVPIRHPGSMTASRAESILAKDDPKFRQEQFLLWEEVLAQIVRDPVNKGKIIPVRYGPDIDTFLEDFFRRKGIQYRPKGFKMSHRKYDNNYWNREEIVARMEKIKLLWALHGLEFPYPGDIV